MVKRIDFYLLRQILGPLITVLAISAMLLLLERMLRLFDLVINQGGPVDIVWKMLATLLPHYLGMAIPLGLFLGVLLAFRKLSLNSELDALRACGFGLHRLLAPGIALAIVLFAVDIMLAGFIQPYSRYTFHELRFELASGAFGASVKVGEYNRLSNDFTLRIDKSHNEGQNLLGIFAQKERKDGHTTTITARKGAFFRTSDGRTILLRLYDGLMVDVSNNRESPSVLSFKVYDWPITLPETEAFRTRGAQHNEYTLPELWRFVYRSPPDAETPRLQAELHARILRALTVLVLPFLAVPLGVVSKRSGRGFGIGLGVLLVLTYHKIMQFGEALAGLGDIPVWLALWAPFVVVCVTTGYLFHNAAFTIAESPLARLEAGWVRLVDAIHDLFTSKKQAAS
jgi:lipopolysaccharide export system permease protein